MFKFSSVTELLLSINFTLENSLGDFSFEGEISEFQVAQSGHLYFTVKDENSQVSCAMWKSSTYAIKFQPKQGDKVICQGKASIYGKSGRFQIIVSSMALQGEGTLKKKYEELKKKLELEGLFDESRKRQLPFLPKSIGVVTSKTGAVIHDIMFKIKERMPSVQVYLIDVRVQGKGAEEEIAKAINKFNRLNNIDVLIVGRGGGSLEDLWCFNEEVVARAIFASKIPVISAVGHESDISLSDLVADVRAPTPTGAAEITVPLMSDLLKTVSFYEERFKDFNKFLLPYFQNVSFLEERFRNVFKNKFLEFRLSFEKVKLSFQKLTPRHQIQIKRKNIESLKIRLEQVSPIKIIQKYKDIQKSLQENLLKACKNLYLKKRGELEKQKAVLSFLDYKKTLKRGFSILKFNNKILKSSEDVLVNDVLEAKLYKGSLEIKVLKKE